MKSPAWPARERSASCAWVHREQRFRWGSNSGTYLACDKRRCLAGTQLRRIHDMAQWIERGDVSAIAGQSFRRCRALLSPAFSHELHL